MKYRDGRIIDRSLPPDFDDKMRLRQSNDDSLARIIEIKQRVGK